VTSPLLTTSIYSGTAVGSILDIPTGTQFAYDSTQSTGRLPAFCSGSCGFVGDGTYYANVIFVGSIGAAHRGYFFSHYLDDVWNQAGLFEWVGSHNQGQVLGQVNEPLGYAATGFAEVYVR
jgi:hypothetical protein